MQITINLKPFSYYRIIQIPKLWAQLGIIISTILVSMVAAYWGKPQHLLLILVVIAGFATFLILSQQKNIGFILILLAGMFAPFTGPGGINATVLMIVLLIGLWLLDMLTVKRKIIIVKSRALVPVIVFLIVSITAFGMGQIKWFSFAPQAPMTAQAGGFAIFALSLGVFLLSAHLIREVQWLEIIVWAFIGLGTLFIFGRIIRSYSLVFAYQNGFTANSMFWTWLVALALSQAIFNNKLKYQIRWLLLLIVITTFYVALVQAFDWKSGWVPPLIAVAILIGMRYKHLAILAVPFALMISIYLAIQVIATDEYSWGTRMDAWLIVLEMSRISPLLGLGFGNYRAYTPLYQIRGWSVQFNSHSQYVDLIAQVGILGLLSFLWIFFEIGRLAWTLADKLPDGFAKAYSYGIFAGLIGTLVAASLVDWVLPFVYNIGFNGFRASVLPWIFFGGLISIEQIYKSKLVT